MIFCLADLVAPHSGAAESLYARKIVSIVYDDSGSMRGDKEAYANYALQSFCGILNSEDRLFITYMRDSQTNRYTAFEVDLSTGGIQPSLDSIRRHTSDGNTPYRAVELAMDQLRIVQDADQNTQYWLVVITDGQFTDTIGPVDDRLSEFVKKDMPNGTKPKITFLSIGEDAVSIKSDPNTGIFEYHAKDASEIVSTMSEMADMISGRTRLSGSNLRQVDGSTIRIESSVPILNLVVFAQKTDAGVVDTNCNGEVSLATVRSAHMRYPGYPDLQSRSYLIGDSQKPIEAGTYDVVFDKNVDVNNVVILVEPALELRVSVEVNGKPIASVKELDALHKKDEVSVSCKICEIGTDKEIPPSLLPGNTTYSVQLLEKGAVKKENNSGSMSIDRYRLNDVETTIKASVTIDSFKLRPYSVTFTPASEPAAVTPPPTPVPTPEPTPTPKPDYRIDAAPKSSLRSVNWLDVASNTEVGVVFTFFENGRQITDQAQIEGLNWRIDVSPGGNDGVIEYRKDGAIVFTPNAAAMVSGASGSIDVSVRCTIDDGTFAEEHYSVLLSDYQVVPDQPQGSAVKTELYGNTAGVRFYVTRDGVRLPKAELDGKCSASLDEKYRDLNVSMQVDADGTIVCVPYSAEEFRLTFFNWWINWYRYWFVLPGGKLDVKVSTPFGTGTDCLEIRNAPLSYRLLNVYLPLFLEIAFITVLTIWLILYFKKPRYAKNAKLYVGTIRYDAESDTHVIRGFQVKNLAAFNRFRYLWRFKKDAEVVYANGINVRADHGGRIFCEEMMPWYRGRVTPSDITLQIRTPEELEEYFRHARSLSINAFSTVNTINGDRNHSIGPASNRDPQYLVVPDTNHGVLTLDDRVVLNRGKIFIYTT